MRTVDQLLEVKGRHVWTIVPDASVFEAIKLMADKHVGALVVVEKDKVAGIISERDYARKVILKDKSSKQTRVRDIMTDKVVAVTPDRTVEQCMAVMTEKRIRHLPVLQEQKLAGILSIGDLVKEIISEKEFMIQQLENYIAG